MKKRFLATAFMAVPLASPPWAQAGKETGGLCDRVCLQGLVDQYLADLLTHDA
jgi:hypothetical protein